MGRRTKYPAELRGEASALRWDDIEEATGIVRVVRGNWRGQEVPSTKSIRLARSSASFGSSAP